MGRCVILTCLFNFVLGYSSRAREPSSDLLAFSAGFSDDMVLQRWPRQAAVYGLAATDDTLQVEVDGNDGCQHVSYAADVGTAPFQDMFAWKALLQTQSYGGSYTIMVRQGKLQVNITGVTFGDVWYCSGQHSATLDTRQISSSKVPLELIEAGRYASLRYFTYGGMSSKVLATEPHWAITAGADLAWHNVTWSSAQASSDSEHSAFNRFSAGCLQFGMSLVDEMEARGEDTAVPIGLIQNADEVSQMERWVDEDALSDCEAPSTDDGDGPPSRLWYGMVTPFVNMTLTGWLVFLSSRNVPLAGGGRSLGSYSCTLPKLVLRWRGLWATVPGTTDAAGPFGVTELNACISEDDRRQVMALPNIFGAQTCALADQRTNIAYGSADSDQQHCELSDPGIPSPRPECLPSDNFRRKLSLASRLAKSAMAVMRGDG